LAGSPAGIAFAGRHAEVVFTGGMTQSDVRRNIEAMRKSAAEAAQKTVGALGGALDRTMAALRPYLLELRLDHRADDA